MSVYFSNYVKCCDCGLDFGVPDYWLATRKEDRNTFWCPNGHKQSFVNESEADKLRRERDRLKQQLAQRDDEIASTQKAWDAAERKAKRIAKRANAGTCQCCHRTFTNVARHMASKHPDVGPNGSVTKFVPKPRVAEVV